MWVPDGSSSHRGLTDVPTGSSASRWFQPVSVAVVTVSALAIIDALSGPRIILAGLLAVGPCLAAVSGRSRAVLAVGAYALVLVSALAWWPDRIWGSLHYLLYAVGVIGVTSVSYGIARQVRALTGAASRLEERRGALADLVYYSDDAIIGTTPEGVVTVWNQGAERMLGYTADEAVGTAASQFALPDGVELDRDALMARIGAGERGIRYETQALHKDGSIIDVAVTLSPVLDSDGAVVGASRVARDLTATKRAEASQRTAEERSQHAQRMASVGQLASGIAHDFNNLLTIILTFTRFAADKGAAGACEDIEADLAKVESAAERAAGLTHQLLTFSRQDTIRPEIIDINATITEVHGMLARTIGEHLELVVRPSPTELMICADAGQVHQIMMNLAINARDAMPAGGTLLIEANEVDVDAQQADLLPRPAGGRYVQLIVSDTGTGMSAETIGRIFEPFYTTKPKGYGTGLGLANVYGIVTDAGGSIHVYSEIDVGTTFHVYFPQAQVPEGASTTRLAAAAAPRGHGQAILVVEDEPLLAQAVERILHGGGYQVLSATGGSEALALQAEYACDLLLTDVVMPEMSGRRLAELLHQRCADLPVLYMSGYTNGLLGAARILDPGIAFIEKPFSRDRLLSEVAVALNGAQELDPAR